MACGHPAAFYNSIRCAAEAATSIEERRSPLDSCRALLRSWASRARERNALSDLDDRLLDDIGVPQESAEREWRKPFWQAGGNK
jgi:uncharacterized protein YjiS (DUF1127 family)